MQDDGPDHKKPYYWVGSLGKGLRILEILAVRGALSVTQVGAELGLNRTAAHRFLATLRDLGYVSQDSHSRYQLTLKLFELGNQVSNIVEVRRVARPYMMELVEKYRETVNLGKWDGRYVLHIDKAESREVLRVDSPIGSRAPAHCVALGKALLAFRPENERRMYLEKAPFEARTPNTITTAERLAEEIDRVRAEGYATDNEELCEGLRCVAVPIFDSSPYPSYAMSMSGPAQRMTPEKMQSAQSDLRRICAEISRELGR